MQQLKHYFLLVLIALISQGMGSLRTSLPKDFYKRLFQEYPVQRNEDLQPLFRHSLVCPN